MVRPLLHVAATSGTFNIMPLISLKKNKRTRVQGEREGRLTVGASACSERLSDPLPKSCTKRNKGMCCSRP